MYGMVRGNPLGSPAPRRFALMASPLISGRESGCFVDGQKTCCPSWSVHPSFAGFHPSELVRFVDIVHPQTSGHQSGLRTQSFSTLGQQLGSYLGQKKKKHGKPNSSSAKVWGVMWDTHIQNNFMKPKRFTKHSRQLPASCHVPISRQGRPHSKASRGKNKPT